MVEVKRLITNEVALIPRPKDGVDGRDGFGFDDVSVDPAITERILTIRFRKGDHEKTFPVKLVGLPLYKGVFRSESAPYEAGDTVTWDGSGWIAKDAVEAKPGTSDPASRSWLLAVKRGGDGKTGATGKPGPQGLRGEKGIDGRNWSG
jgi:hypothetical protein